MEDFRGLGTVVNVATVLVGSGIGVLVGRRLPNRTRDVVTDGLGLVTLLIAGVSAAAVGDDELTAAVGDSAPVLIVLGMIALVMAVLSITQRDNAGNEPIPAPKKTTSGSSVAAVS